jgi:hypothetical protein
MALKRWILTTCLALIAASSSVAQLPDLVTDLPPSSGPTQVKAGLYYIDISEIEGATETFAATAYILLEWNDPRLRFPSKDGSKVRLYKPEDIWTPGVEIVNAQKLDDQEPPLCTVTSDGTVYYARRVVGLLNTPMDLRRFPFDRQQLNVILESSRYGTDDLTLVPDAEQSGLGTDIVPRGWAYDPLAWKVLKQPFAKTDQTYSRLIFSFEARRIPFYFIWKIILPTAIFVFLTWSIFWMQVHDVQTALLVSITILLTAVAFGNVTDSLLPKLGYRTWLDQFQLGSFLFIVVAVIEAITVQNLDLAGKTDRAVRIRRILRVGYPVGYTVFCVVLSLLAIF